MLNGLYLLMPGFVLDMANKEKTVLNKMRLSEDF